MFERRNRFSTNERGASPEVEVSTRYFSAQATSGRNTTKLVPTTMITMAPIPMATLDSDPLWTAAPM